MQDNKELLKQDDDILLEVKNLKMYFDITTGFFKTTPLKAVDNVSFKIKRGETLGVVGESGCGKTTLGRSIMNLYNPTSGDIIFDGLSISSYSDLKKIKIEKKNERKDLVFEMNKKVKTYLKEELNGDLSTEENKNKYNYFKTSALAKLQSDMRNLDLWYDKKYEDKKTEIVEEIKIVKDNKEASLTFLKKVEKSSDSKIAEVDAKVKELKEKALADIAEEKKLRDPKIEAAKAQKFASMQLLKDKKIQDKVRLKNSSNKKKCKKDNYVEERVMYEKIVADYNVEKSKAYGTYQKSVNEIKAKLKSDIKAARAESEYYLYVDSVNDINAKEKAQLRRIKSSSKYKMKQFRKQCTMVFQDPYSSLNPRMTVQDIIAEPLDVNHLYETKEERRSKVLDLMKKVGLSPEQSTRYAHEFSGGQRQRIGIARALAVNPKFIVCDEPVSALDVSIQAQVINTFEDLQKELGLTYLFIAHDLLVVRHISNRIMVMYLGKVVELAETNELFEGALHPYTISLLSAVPQPDPKSARANKRIILEGDVPSPMAVPTGCPFRTRCPRACAKCKEEVPQLKEVKPGHFVSCILVQEEIESKSN